MEAFVEHFFALNQTDYDLYFPLQRAKNIIDILSPLIIFSLSTDDKLLIHNINQTKLTIPMYEYYMQFKIYPQYKQFLKQKENFCKRVFESFYPPEQHIDLIHGYDMDYETAKPFLKEYYGITEDPRQLKTMKQSGNSVTYTKERWYEFIRRMTPGCSDSYNMSYEMNQYYQQLSKWIKSLSVQLPTDSIWKYLMAVKYFLQ